MIGRRVQHTRVTVAGQTGRDLLGPAMLVLIGAAWLVVAAGQLTGNASLGHVHGAPPASLPIWLGLASFLLSWQVMVAATMLPATLPSIRRAAAATGDRLRPGRSAVMFLAGFAVVWTTVGLLAFVGGQVVGEALGANGWLAARPWLLQASIVALAGAYQLSPMKRRSLAACRQPDPPDHARAAGSAVFQTGVRHGLACLGSSWALMAVMVVAGLGDLWWMAALAGVMVYEATGRHGQRLAVLVSPLLLWVSALILLPGWLPA